MVFYHSDINITVYILSFQKDQYCQACEDFAPADQGQQHKETPHLVVKLRWPPKTKTCELEIPKFKRNNKDFMY